MPRFFNTTGPCNPEKHYFLPPQKRLIGSQFSRYIKDELYWVLHAPRQTGKTTFLQTWMREINASDQAIACYVSVERCQQLPLASESIPAICEAVISYAQKFLSADLVPSLPHGEFASILDILLSDWAKLVAPKPLVVLFDEVDVLENQVGCTPSSGASRDQTMISFLRQLRGGFAGRGVGKFPVSIALVGMSDLRDYLIQSKDGKPINPGSPFNIKQDSATLGNFTHKDIIELADQHTIESGQKFSSGALQKVYDFTRGQPWLTNALLQKCVWTICPDNEPVTAEHISTAREMLIQERAVHPGRMGEQCTKCTTSLDSLAERLRDSRVKRIVQTIITGDIDPTLTDGDDFRYTVDMGLVVKENGTPVIANPIYRETIVRVLSQGMQDAIPVPEWPWQKEDGSLDMDELMTEFQKFWRRHSDTWEIKADYTEAFPHLLLMAFLQRITNGGGRIDREYAAGRGRMDIAVSYGGKITIIEIKLVHSHDGRALTVEEGLIQIRRYRDSVDPHAACYLVVFDRTPAGRQKPWEERITREVIGTGRDAVVVIGA